MDVDVALAWAEVVTGPIKETRVLTGGWTSQMLALVPESGQAAVLRLITREPWRRHGPALTTREREIQLLLADTPVPAPLSRAIDAEGLTCGAPAHLMSLLPGAVDVDRVDAGSLHRLAEVLAAIHDVVPAVEVRTYESWVTTQEVPSWVGDRGLWEAAFAVLSADPPAYERVLIHRDFHLRNVLWSDGQVSGVVDWVETSIGPAWLDVAHCCTNLALDHGVDVADRFADAYVRRTGREPQWYFDVMDVVGFLPPPGEDGFFEEADEQRRLEERLRSVLERLDR